MAVEVLEENIGERKLVVPLEHRAAQLRKNLGFAATRRDQVQVPFLSRQ